MLATLIGNFLVESSTRQEREAMRLFILHVLDKVSDGNFLGGHDLLFAPQSLADA